MSRFARVLPVVAGIALFAGVATADHGRKLDALMVEYFTWALGGDQADHDGSTVFMPIPSGGAPDADGVSHGEMDVTLRTSDKFFLPIFVFFGERYDDGTPDDDPDDHSLIPSEQDFLDSDLLVEIDGQTVISSASGPLDDFFVSPQYFADPIVYDTPTDYHSVSALWIEGLGFEHKSLKKGTHTLHLRITNPFLMDTYGFAGWENVWNLTVTK